MNQNIQQAILFAPYSWAGISTPLLNTADYLLEHNWSLVIYAPNNDSSRFAFPSRLATHLIFVPSNASFLSKLKTIFFLRSICKSSSLIIFYDHYALRFYPVSAFTNAKRVYYSLEFQEYSSIHGSRLINQLRYCLSKLIEKSFAQACDLVVSQDLQRCNFLQQDLGVTRLSYIPNSPRNLPVLNDNSYFRAKFSIPDSTFILLCIGTLNNDMNLDFVLEAVPLLSDDFAIVLHGWFTSPEQARMAHQLASAFPSALYISTELLTSDEKWRVYQGADFVFVGFSSINMNHRLAIGSAGKLYDALSCGKPILFKLEEQSSIFTPLGVGKYVTRPSELSDALIAITTSYNQYRTRCLAASQMFRHDFFMEKTMNLLFQHSDS